MPSFEARAAIDARDEGQAQSRRLGKWAIGAAVVAPEGRGQPPAEEEADRDVRGGGPCLRHGSEGPSMMCRFTEGDLGDGGGGATSREKEAKSPSH